MMTLSFVVEAQTTTSPHTSSTARSALDRMRRSAETDRAPDGVDQRRDFRLAVAVAGLSPSTGEDRPAPSSKAAPREHGSCSTTAAWSARPVRRPTARAWTGRPCATGRSRTMISLARRALRIIASTVVLVRLRSGTGRSTQACPPLADIGGQRLVDLRVLIAVSRPGGDARDMRQLHAGAVLVLDGGGDVAVGSEDRSAAAVIAPAALQRLVIRTCRPSRVVWISSPSQRPVRSSSSMIAACAGNTVSRGELARRGGQPLLPPPAPAIEPGRGAVLQVITSLVAAHEDQAVRGRAGSPAAQGRHSPLLRARRAAR